MNTLNIEAQLAKTFGYRPLPSDLSDKYRKFFEENIPENLKLGGDNKRLYTKTGSLICNQYDRIVIGDYGAFIEFSEESIANEFVIQSGQEYRVNDIKYAKNVKYIWMTIDDGSNIKIYKQKRKVAYADYVPRKYYISVHEVQCE